MDPTLTVAGLDRPASASPGSRMPDTMSTERLITATRSARNFSTASSTTMAASSSKTNNALKRLLARTGKVRAV